MGHQGQEHRPGSGDPGEERGLVLLSAGTERPRLHDVRPDAAFVAQIIASASHMGPYRRYRRAEPQTAMKSYGERTCNALPPRLALTA